MTDERFKFVKELKLSNKSLEKTQLNQQFNLLEQKSMIYCHFDNIREQTPNEEGKPFKCFRENPPSFFTVQKKDQRCYFNKNMLQIYSRGGSEFIVPIHFNIQNVFSIEDGIIIKAYFNQDLIFYDPFKNKENQSQLFNNEINDSDQMITEQTTNQNQSRYAYFTITKHPLDDICPLSFNGNKDLINTSLELIHVSYKIPICLLYNQRSNSISVCILKEKAETNNNTEEDSYIRNIEPQSRNPYLFNVSKEYKMLLEQLCNIQAVSCPDQIFLSKGFNNPFEIVIALYFNQSKRIQMYSCDIREQNSINNIKLIENVQSALLMSFNRNESHFQDSIKIIPKQLYQQISNSQTYKKDFEIDFFKKRLKLLKKNLVILDQNGKNISFYQGSVQILQIDLSQLLPKNIKVDILSDPSKSNINMTLSNGLVKRLSIRFQIQDFLIRSILKIFKTILPESLYITLYQDIVEQFSKQINNIDIAKQCDQFTHFSNIILQILTGDLTMTLKPIQNNLIIQQTPSNLTSPNQKSDQKIQQNIISTTQQKPSQTLQTKILRSSTTSFGTDSLSRRKIQQSTVQVNQQTTQQQQQNTQKVITQQNVQQSNIKGGVQTRTSMTSSQLSQNQFKRVSTGSSEVQPLTTSLSRTNALINTQIQGNPFAELLNSDFHKENIHQFKQYFPSDFKFPLPNEVMSQTLIIPPVTQIINQSPTKQQTKSSGQSGNNTQGSATQKIASNKQQTVLNQERRSSTNSYVLASGQSVQQQQQNLQYLNTIQNNFKTQKSDFIQHQNNILFILHLLHEELKLNKLREMIECPKLAKLIIKWILLSDPQKKSAYLDYYFKEYPNLSQEYEQDIKKYYSKISQSQIYIEIEPVPMLYRWLESYFKNQQSLINYPFPLFFERTRKIARIYEILSNTTLQQSIPCSFFSPFLLSQYKQNEIQNQIFKGVWMGSNRKYIIREENQIQDYLMNQSFRNLHLFEKVLFCLKEENLGLDDIKRFPTMISLPIIEIIRFSRLFQQEIQSIPKWPDSLYKLIQREDILNNLRLFERLSNEEDPSNQYSMLNKNTNQLMKQTSKRFALNRGVTNVFTGQTIEELKLEDMRKQMESNILQTTGDLMNDRQEDYKDIILSKNPQSEKNSYLSEFLKKRFNQDTRYKEVSNMLSSQTDMIIKLEHIANHESLPEEKLHIEKQTMLDHLFLRQLAKCVGRGALTFGTQQTLPTEILQIPKISQTGYVPQTESYMSVEFKDEQKDTLNWPEFHNGVASALRIASCLLLKNNKIGGNSNQQSYQPATTRNWIMYHKPPNEPKFEHGGFLLAIGLLGQLDSLQPTDIYQHLKTGHDATTIGILLGRAASKISTMDDHDTRTLCIHIPYLLPPSLSIDISLAIQSAAVIGAGLLYKGTSNRLMTEMLLAQIGRKPLSDKAIEREGYALASGIALGLVNLGVGQQMQGISDLKLNERLIRFVEGGKTIDLPQSMLSVNYNHDNAKCSAIKEGDMVNVHITSPGAVIALALIHLKSNNETLCNKLSMPQTFYALEFVKPQFLLLKVLCKNLIMWDQIQCFKAWIFQQIPQIIREIYENDINTVEKKFSQRISEEEIDYSTVALCYVNIIAGAILSLGFKYAGTGNKEVYTLIADMIQFFRKLKIVSVHGKDQQNHQQLGQSQHTNITKNQVDKNTMETNLCVGALSASIVMAGTGDTDCFRLIRVLRKRFEHDMHYGYNMAIHMSLGFLFLGSGAYTFSRSNLSIAALLCSLYPVFPTNPSDNRYHLQALRHFYILAVETRLLQARDIDSGEFVNIMVDVELEEKDDCSENEHKIKNIQMQTPAIINGKLRKIEVKNQMYHYVCLKLNQEQENSMMDIDEQLINNTVINQNDKQSKGGLESSTLQQIIYVKKITSYQNEKDKGKTDNNNTQITKFYQNNYKLKVLLESQQEQQLKDLVIQYPNILQNLSQIKDSQIEILLKCFAQIDFSLFQPQIEMPEVEDILLSQCRDPFNQIGVKEFFKIQDTYDYLKKAYSNCIIPFYLRRRLLTLQTLYHSCTNDKIEATGILLEMIDFHENKEILIQKDLQNISLLSQYTLFLEKLNCNLSFQKSSCICDLNSLPLLSQKKNQLTTLEQKEIGLAYVQQLGEMLITLNQEQNSQISRFDKDIRNQQQDVLKIFGIHIGPHEIQIAKNIVEQVLNELKMQGEIEIVKQYCLYKIKNTIDTENVGKPIKSQNQDGPLNEINEALNLAMLSIFGEGNHLKTEFINNILLPGLMYVINI